MKYDENYKKKGVFVDVIGQGCYNPRYLAREKICIRFRTEQKKISKECSELTSEIFLVCQLMRRWSGFKKTMRDPSFPKCAARWFSDEVIRYYQGERFERWMIWTIRVNLYSEYSLILRQERVFLLPFLRKRSL